MDVCVATSYPNTEQSYSLTCHAIRTLDMTNNYKNLIHGVDSLCFNVYIRTYMLAIIIIYY